MKKMQLLSGGKSLGRLGMTIFLGGMFLAPAAVFNVAYSQETEGLKLPEDIAARAGQETTDQESEESSAGELSLSDDRKYLIEERRVGGRLERVTVRRKNGLDEVYENPNVDSMWVTEDKELGEVQNVRRWTIGSW